VWDEASLPPTPTLRLISASIDGVAAFTVTAKPFASGGFTQLPQQAQVADFPTSIDLSVVAKAGAAQQSDCSATIGRKVIVVSSWGAKQRAYVQC
jgi:hypothetical protein